MFQFKVGHTRSLLSARSVRRGADDSAGDISIIYHLRYHVGVTKADKIRARIAVADANLRFEQIDSYLRGLGVASRQSGGSHVVYLFPGGGSATVVKPHGGRKTVNPRYVASLHEQLTKEEKATS